MPPCSPRVKGSGGLGSATSIVLPATSIETMGAGALGTEVPSCAGEDIFPRKGQPSHPPGFRSAKVVHRVGPRAKPRTWLIFWLVSASEYPACPLLHWWISSSPSTEWQSNWMPAYQCG